MIDDLIEQYPDDDQKAAVIAALAEAAQEYGNDELMDYAIGLLQGQIDKRNTCIYRQYMDDLSREYVSLGAIDRCRVKSGFRYVRKQNDVTMSQVFGGSASYTFTVGSKNVSKNNGDTNQLSANAAEQTDPYLRQNSETKYGYIPEEDAQKFLGNTCVYINTTDWAVLVTPSGKDVIEETARAINEYIAQHNQ